MPTRNLSILLTAVDRTSKPLSKVGKGFAALAVPVAAAGAAAVSVANDYDEAAKKIEVGTGASGRALDGLVKSFRNVNKTVPQATGNVAGALADLNTLTGATGKTLEDLTGNVLDASRMLGEEGAANAKLFGQAMQQWQIPAEQGTAKLDQLFKVTQDYGIGLGEVTTQLNEYGSVLSNAGFNMAESAVLFGRLNKSGLAVSRLMPGLNMAFRNWASEGKNSREELIRTITQMRNAGSSTKALSIATEQFGAEGAQRLVTAVRNGSFSLQGLSKELQGSRGAVERTAESTLTAGEKLQILRKRAEALLLPLGELLLDAGIALADVFSNRIVPAIEAIGGWMNRNRDIVIGLASAIGALVVVTKVHAAVLAVQAAGGVAKYISVVRPVQALTRTWTAVQWALNAAMSANPIGIVIAIVVALVAAIVIAYRRSETFRRIVQAAWAGIKIAIQAAWNFIRPVLATLGRVIGTVLVAHFNILRTIAKIVWIAIRAAIKAAWVVIRPIFKAVVAFVRNVLAPIFKWLWNKVIKPAWNGIGSIIKGAWNRVIRPAFNAVKAAVGKVRDAFETAVDGIRRVWDRIKGIAKKPVNFVIGVYNDGIVALVNRVAKFAGLKTRIGEIPKLARGGVMPGFAPGRDTLLANVSPGESIFRPEFTRAVGSKWVDNANRVARTDGARGVAKFLFGVGDPSGVPGFALGGVVKDFVGAVRNFGNPVKLARSAMDTMMGTVPGAGVFRDVVAGIPRWIANKIVDWVTSIKDRIFGGGGGAVVRAARSQLGLPYSWGGGGKGGPSFGIGRGANTLGFDCSGLTEYGWWKGAKASIGGTTFTQLPNSRSIGGPRPGALGFPHRGHVFLSAVPGKTIIEAPFTGGHVREVAQRRADWRWPKGATMDRGGMLRPGWNPPIFNGTGAPEVVTPTRGPDAVSAAPMVGTINLNHVPGFTTRQDLVRGLRQGELAARYHRRR